MFDLCFSMLFICPLAPCSPCSHKPWSLLLKDFHRIAIVKSLQKVSILQSILQCHLHFRDQSLYLGVAIQLHRPREGAIRMLKKRVRCEFTMNPCEQCSWYKIPNTGRFPPRRRTVLTPKRALSSSDAEPTFPSWTPNFGDSVYSR